MNPRQSERSFLTAEILMSRLGHAVLVLAGMAALGGCVSVDDEQDLENNAIVDLEIDRRIGELKYMRGRELLRNQERLAHMRDLAYPHLREALKSDDPMTRASVIYVFEIGADRRNLEYIRPLLRDSVPFVRYQAASTAVEMGDPSGFDTLIEGMRDENIRWRFKCFEALRLATGRDFGYRHDDDPETRETALERWTQWLGEVRASAL